MPPTGWPAGGTGGRNWGGGGALTVRRHYGSELDGQVLIAVLILEHLHEDFAADSRAAVADLVEVGDVRRALDGGGHGAEEAEVVADFPARAAGSGSLDEPGLGAKEVGGLSELEGDDATGVGDGEAADGIGLEGGLHRRVFHDFEVEVESQGVDLEEQLAAGERAALAEAGLGLDAFGGGDPGLALGFGDGAPVFSDGGEHGADAALLGGSGVGRDHEGAADLAVAAGHGDGEAAFAGLGDVEDLHNY